MGRSRRKARGDLPKTWSDDELVSWGRDLSDEPGADDRAPAEVEPAVTPEIAPAPQPEPGPPPGPDDAPMPPPLGVMRSARPGPVPILPGRGERLAARLEADPPPLTGGRRRPVKVRRPAGDELSSP